MANAEGESAETETDEEEDEEKDYSGIPPVPVGGPSVYPIHAASGVGYGQSFAANAHRHVPDNWLAAVRFLIEEAAAEVDIRDVNAFTALHHAASRGDDDLIQYLVEHGADVTVVSRKGQTTADMANGPQQRTPPYLTTVALLESLGSKNNHKCVSC
jgi:ankyrin repeat protein